MPPNRQDLPRPQPTTSYRLLVRNEQVRTDWDQLVRTRRELCIRCWDHLASEPVTAIGSRYLPLKGSQKWIEFEGHRLPQWQFEIDRGARVKVDIGADFVVIVNVSSGHPKENE